MAKMGLNIERYFSEFGNPYDDSNKSMGYSNRDATIINSDGKIVEQIPKVIFPDFWSQNAVNTVATKYFRREGVPKTGREIDVRQMTGRIGKTISEWGIEQEYFDKKNAKVLEHEIVVAMTGQYGFFNSPVEFNLGLDKYGLTKKEETFYVKDGKVKKVENYFANPQVAACFISSPKDNIPDMINVGAVISSKIFKGGSGIGGDWSAVRSAGEPVSGGGVASGAKRFMDVQDAAGRVIKSGGISRRAATMQSIGIWHADAPEIWIDKYKEERKGEVLVRYGSPSNWESHTFQDLRSQNVNISTRIDDEFWEAYEKDGLYSIRRVIDGSVIKDVRARDLLEMMSFATHGCGDPGVQNHSIINKWNTVKSSGEIWASNPCSEFMHLDNSACNLASLNLMRYRLNDGELDINSFCKAIDLFITAQDIMVSPASYPTKEIAKNSDAFRPIGLGYANLGAYTMSLGLPYDSDEARNFASAVTSLMTAEAYLQSTKLAEKLGPFKEFNKNKKSMLEVINMHKEASNKITLRYKGLEKLITTANSKWDDVLKRGEKYGFRNDQVTLLAPTGTIGIAMDCDTTGGEPVHSLESYKELSGGGSMIIVNQTVPLALDYLGYGQEDISKIIKYVKQNKTVEGCDTLKEKHLPVFDCAVSSGNGKRSIFPMGHIKMLGAIQPFVSGSISKTVNCPNNTTVEEIQEMFYQGWKNGLKAVAIYRDGSKVSQPLRTKKQSNIEILARGERESLPDIRKGITQKVKINNVPLFIRTGEYFDGRLGEVFIDSLQRGSEINRLLNENAIQFSEKLQYGVSLKNALEIFTKAGKSQISGFTDHQFIKTANGVEGFLFDWIRAHYLGDISFLKKDDGTWTDPEMRPLPSELRVYQQVPDLHMFPTVVGVKFYPDAPSLEETIKKISGENYWKDNHDGLDTRKTLEKIKRNRTWNGENNESESWIMTGSICEKCGNMMVSDGSCLKCLHCKTSTGGCGGG